MSDSDQTDAEDPRLTTSELRVVRSAHDHLEGERPVAVFRGQTFISPVLAPVVGQLLFLFAVRPRSVIVTPQSVVTVQESIWSQSRIVRVVSRHRRGEVPIRATRLGLQVGEEPKVFARPGALRTMREIVALGSRTADAAAER